MLGTQKRWQEDLFIAGPLSSLIPDDHILKQVDKVLDLSWLRKEVADLYCSNNGRPSIDPEAAVRLMLAGFFQGVVHDRKLMREAQVNLAIRWFAGYRLDEKLPDHSSLTKIRQRWGTDRFKKIFLPYDSKNSPGQLSDAIQGESSIHGLYLDWMRFITYQTIDFYKAELEPIREVTPDIPVTTNFMGFYPGLNYWEFAKEVDVVSWDNYPNWHRKEDDVREGSNISFLHDLNRSFKNGRPFMIMESTPSVVSCTPINKYKDPGMHLLSSLQAVAHGSDSILYFQWRKSRGGWEKFWGAVVDHCGHENTRVFRDVAELGKTLTNLDAIIGTGVQPEAAIIYDWENAWAIDKCRGLRSDKGYIVTCQNHYYQLWSRGISTDIIDEKCDFSKYKLLIGPMLYMLRPNVAERIEKFVADGGTFVATYWTGITDENDLCFLGGFPGPLRKVLGLWAEEIDALCPHEVNYIEPTDKKAGLNGKYQIREICEHIHAETAKVLAAYTQDYYAGQPALTVNEFGKGKAYYIASRNEERFLNDLYANIITVSNIQPVISAQLPTGVTAQMRTDGKRQFVFLMNFAAEPKKIDLKNETFKDIQTDTEVKGKITLEKYAVKILETK